jgi:hypothetical protein
MSAHQIIKLTLCVVVSALIAYGVADGLKAGKVRLRGGTTVYRAKNPLMFWFSVSAGTGFVAVFMWVAVRICLEAQP